MEGHEVQIQADDSMINADMSVNFIGKAHFSVRKFKADSLF